MFIIFLCLNTFPCSNVFVFPLFPPFYIHMSFAFSSSVTIISGCKVRPIFFRAFYSPPLCPVFSCPHFIALRCSSTGGSSDDNSIVTLFYLMSMFSSIRPCPLIPLASYGGFVLAAVSRALFPVASSRYSGAGSVVNILVLHGLTICS